MNYTRDEIQNEQQYRNALNKFSTWKMELPSKILEQIAFNTRPKIEEHMLILWIGVLMKIIYLNHYKLIINNPK